MNGLGQSVVRDNGLLDYSRLKGMMLQAWSPFQKGFFDGVFIGDRETYGELNDVLNELAETHGVTPIGIAVAWIVRHPANIQVVLGTTNRARGRIGQWIGRRFRARSGTGPVPRRRAHGAVESAISGRERACRVAEPVITGLVSVIHALRNRRNRRRGWPGRGPRLSGLGFNQVEGEKPCRVSCGAGGGGWRS